MKKGKLIAVELAPGRFVKMYEQDAIDRGLIKAKPQAKNKMRVPKENKAPAVPAVEEESEAPEAAAPDDFTQIAGVGQATARALVAHGITTFAQLREAVELAYLNTRTNQAIEAWRNG